MTQHTVKVWDSDYVVDVHQKSKSVWIAVGEYKGERIEVKGRSEYSALKGWREAARYKGN